VRRHFVKVESVGRLIRKFHKWSQSAD
jgi:hypothetical protein